MVARFFIHQCKYSKSKPNMPEYFNVLNTIKISEYGVAKKIKSIDEHYKIWRYVCNFS